MKFWHNDGKNQGSPYFFSGVGKIFRRSCHFYFSAKLVTPGAFII